MSIPRYSTISVESPIARAKLQCRCSNTTEWDSYFEIMIMEGMGSLNVLSQLIKKQCKITITDGTAEIPKGLVRFLAMRGHCRQWTEEELANNPMLTNFNNNIILYADTTFLSSCGCDVTGFQNWINNVQINGNYIHFNNHTSLESATIAFMGLNVDENGKPLIFERYERALAAYASWRYTQMYFEKFNQNIIDGYKQEWIAQASRIRGEDVANDFQNDKLGIAQAVSTLLTSPLVHIYP